MNPLSDLSTVDIPSFLSYLNVSHRLQLSSAALNAYNGSLSDQWITCASDLQSLDQQAIAHLHLPPNIVQAIAAFFAQRQKLVTQQQTAAPVSNGLPPLSPTSSLDSLGAQQRSPPSSTGWSSPTPPHSPSPHPAVLAKPPPPLPAPPVPPPKPARGIAAAAPPPPPPVPQPQPLSSPQLHNKSLSPSPSSHSQAPLPPPPPALSPASVASVTNPFFSAPLPSVPPDAAQWDDHDPFLSLAFRGSARPAASPSAASAAAVSKAAEERKEDRASEGGDYGGGEEDLELSLEGMLEDGVEQDDDDSDREEDEGKAEPLEGGGADSGNPFDDPPAASPLSPRVRHGSTNLVALKRAVEHACSTEVSEQVLRSLQKNLREAMKGSGKINQSVLREHLKRVQAAATGAKAAEEAKGSRAAAAGRQQRDDKEEKEEKEEQLASRMSSLSIFSPFGDEEKKQATAGSGPYCDACRSSHAVSRPHTLDCSHCFSMACLSSYINALVSAKQAVSIACPAPGCGAELSNADIQRCLSAADFEQYLQATLMAFIEQDGSSFICPNDACRSVISIAPFTPPPASLPITEKDEDGRLLSREAWLHYCEFRVRCRECNLIFCASCKQSPYHKGYTCSTYKDYQAARHCRFCSARLDAGSQWKNPGGSIALKDVCTSEDCVKKAEACCDRMLSCGCPCNGIKGEALCLPCLKHDLQVESDYCPICFVEALQDAPCIKMTGPCLHVVHHACALTKIESRWPGARISFEFRTCPMCKQNMAHPALEAVLAPVIAMEKSITDKALQRLKYEGRESEPAIVNKGGEFFNNPVGFALKHYLFYQCFKCSRPYFAGGYQCVDASVQGFDPSELICPSCQPSSVDECKVHGKDWLAYKCRYCCSFANWYCIAAGSRVSMADGTSRSIQSLQHLPRVQTFDDEADGGAGGIRLAPSVRFIDQREKECLQLTFSDGRSLELTADHKLQTTTGMVPAGELALNKSLVLAGPDAPLDTVDPEAEAQFRLSLPACGQELRMTDESSRQRVLAFARILGLLCCDGNVSFHGDSNHVRVALSHRVDVEALQQDHLCLTGQQATVDWTGLAYELHLSSALVSDVRSVCCHTASPDRLLASASLPACITASDCPLAVVREFLGGLLGGSGGAPTLQLGRFASLPLLTSDTQPASPSPLTMQQLQTLLSRFGIQSSARSRNSSKDNAAAREGAAPSVLSLSASELSRFSDAVGFRFSSFKQLRLTAAAAHCRLRRRVIAQQAWLVARVRQLTESEQPRRLPHRSLPLRQAAMQAVRELREQQSVLHPSSVLSIYQLRSAVKRTDFERRISSSRAALVDCREFLSSIGASALFSDDADDALLTAKRVASRASLPVLQLRVLHRRRLGVRRVYDLSVPVSHSFIANGLVVSNCWGNTHFCDKCHKSGVWQQLTVFRSGKNKKKLWEYDNCQSLRPQVDALGKDASLSEEQKVAAIGKLLSAPKACVLGVRHPPTGIEFGLGCIMCEDSQSSSEKLKENEAAVKAKLMTVKTELSRSPRVFRYQYDLDENGVMFYLGTCGRTQPYTNPAEAGFVKVVSSGLMDDSAPLSAAVGRELVRCVTTPVRNSWFVFELVDLSLCLTAYTLRHYNSWDTECLRHWTLEGGNDSLQGPWELIIAHVNDTSLSKKGQTHTWTVPVSSRRYRFFRLFQNGRNSNNNFYLPCSGMELYGTLFIHDAAAVASPSAADAASAQRPKIGPLPPAPARPGSAMIAAGGSVGRVFTYQHDMDTNGICYFLGTRFGTAPYTNPGDLGLVRIRCSELCTQPVGAPITAVVGRELVRVVSAAKPNQWFVIDFSPSGYRIRPSAYLLRHYSSWDLEALRNWKLEASVNGTDWFTLSVHSDDKSLSRKGATHCWQLAGQQGQYTHFRIWQTGFNSNNHHYLALSGFELYGELIDNSQPLSTPFDQLKQQQQLLLMQPPPAPGMYLQQQQPFPIPHLPPPPNPRAHSLPGMPSVHMPRIPPPLPPPMSPHDASSPAPAANLVPLRHRHDMDTNGVFYWLGSRGGTQPWCNPCNTRLVSITCSGLATNPPSAPCSALVNREVVRCVTVAKPDQWFCIDLLGNSLQPSHYTLQHYSSYDLEALRNWRLEASQDGLQFDTLLVHSNDQTLQRRGQTATWEIPQSQQTAGRFYRFFRIHQTGLNSNNNHYLALSGVEMYGWLQLAAGMRNASSPPAIPAAPPRMPLSSPPPVPAALARPPSLPPGVPSTPPPVPVPVNNNNNPFAYAAGPPPRPSLPPSIPQSQPRPSAGFPMSPAAFANHPLSPPTSSPPPAAGGPSPAGNNYNPFADAVAPSTAPHPLAMAAASPPSGSNPFSPAQAAPPPLLSSMSSHSLHSSPAASPSFGQRSTVLSPTGSSTSQSWSGLRPPPPSSFVEGQQFEYAYDFDEGGILYWLGTRQRTAQWKNPDDLGLVRVTSVPLAVSPPSEPASAIVGRSVCRCVTLPNRESWFCVDLLSFYCRPTAYTLRHYDSYDSEALRDWKLQASNDGKKWSKLISHKKDESLQGKGSSHTWPIPACKKAYRMFRILQTGKNSNGHWYCALSGFELYGQLFSQPPKQKD